MDQAIQKVLDQQKLWVEQMMKANTEFIERLALGASTTSTAKSIAPFRQFDVEKESWVSYLFQLQQHFSANAVECDKLRKSHFLSTCGSYLNEVLRKLFQEADVSNHTFKELTERLTKHFRTKLHVLASRCRFLRQKMVPGQSYANWIAELRGLATDCNFVCAKEGCGQSYADFMIRDMVVFYTPHDSVRSSATQKRNPTLEEIEELIVAYESTQLAAEIMKGSSTSAVTTSASEVHQLGASKQTSKSNINFLTRKSCPGCFVHHDRNSCKHLESVCDVCKRRGHIKTVCLSTQQRGSGSQGHTRMKGKNQGRRRYRREGRSAVGTRPQNSPTN